MKDYYIETLKDIQEIEDLLKENKTDEQKETELIKAITFANLIKLDYPFELKQEYKDVEEKSSAFSKTEIKKVLESETVEIKVDDNVYTCNTDILKRVLRKDYAKLVLKEETVEQVDENTISIDLESIDIDFIEKQDEEKRLEEEARRQKEEEERLREEEKEKVVEDEYADPSRLPDFEENLSFDKDTEGSKNHNSFLYNHHVLKSPTNIINVLVYPLSIEENAKIVDIMAICEIEGQIRAVISKGINHAVTVDTGHYSFIIRGSFRNGEFMSSVNPLSNGEELTETNLLKVTPKERMATTFAKMEMPFGNVYIFPVKMDENEDNGLALSAIAIKNESSVKVFTPNAEGKFNLGNSITLETFWMGDSFFYILSNNQ